MDDPRAPIVLLLVVGGFFLRADALALLFMKGKRIRGAQSILLALVAPVVALISFSYLTSGSFSEKEKGRSNIQRILVEIVLFIAAQLSAGWCFFYFIFISGEAIPSGRAIGPLADTGNFLPVHVTIILGLYSVILICLLSIFHRNLEIGDLFKGKKMISTSMIGLGILIPMLLMISFLLHQLGPGDGGISSTAVMVPDNPVDSLFLIIGIVVLAPLIEEIFFRGTLYTILDDKVGTIPAIIVTALIFAVMHFDPIQAIPLFLLGLLMGWLRSRSGSIVPSLVLHSFNNLTALLLISMG